MAGFNPTDLITLLPKLGEGIKSAVEQYGALKAAGMDVTPDLLSAGLGLKLSTWDPSVRGKKLLDDDTKTAMFRFLAGVAFNLSK